MRQIEALQQERPTKQKKKRLRWLRRRLALLTIREAHAPNSLNAQPR